jgi:hypothetical protein
MGIGKTGIKNNNINRRTYKIIKNLIIAANIADTNIIKYVEYSIAYSILGNNNKEWFNTYSLKSLNIGNIK